MQPTAMKCPMLTTVCCLRDFFCVALCNMLRQRAPAADWGCDSQNLAGKAQTDFDRQSSTICSFQAEHTTDERPVRWGNFMTPHSNNFVQMADSTKPVVRHILGNLPASSACKDIPDELLNRVALQEPPRLQPAVQGCCSSQQHTRSKVGCRFVACSPR